jgi:hypothetical protein
MSPVLNLKGLDNKKYWLAVSVFVWIHLSSVLKHIWQSNPNFRGAWFNNGVLGMISFVYASVRICSSFYVAKLSLSLMLRQTVSRPVCLGIKHSSGAYDQIFITVRQLRVCWCGALSLTRGWVCRLQLLLAFVSAVIFGSESRGTRDHILLSQIRDFSFRRLLRLAGLRWGYLTPSPQGMLPNYEFRCFIKQ